MADIFIGYSPSDQARVALIVDALAGLGLSVYWDVELAAGEQWTDVLERELRGASCVLIVWSSNSRDRYYVRREADLARELGKLVTAAIEKHTQPAEYHEVNCAHLEAVTPGTEQAGWLSLLDGISARLKRPGLRGYAVLAYRSDTQPVEWAEWATRYPKDPRATDAWKGVSSTAVEASKARVTRAQEVAEGGGDPELLVRDVRAILTHDLQPFDKVARATSALGDRRGRGAQRRPQPLLRSSR